MADNNWNLTLPISQARKYNEVISLMDSQVLRFIDDINGIDNQEAKVRSIKKQINVIKQEPSSTQNSKEIKELYAALDKLQFKKDYMSVIIDSKGDYYRAIKGFKINNVKYMRIRS